MKILAVVAALAVLVLVGLPFLPAVLPSAEQYGIAMHAEQLQIGALVAAAITLIAVLFVGGGKTASEAPKPAVAEVAKPAPVPVARNQAEAEVVSFLALLQEKGRLVDFLMDDITPYADAQVGAAARVVHEGCRSVLKEYLNVTPVREEQEGAMVTVDASAAADEYRLTGKIAGAAPFTGRLVHRGWQTGQVKLPRVLRSDEDRLPTIAPAEIELS